MRGRRRSVPHGAGPALESLLDDLAPEDAGDVGLARLQRTWRAAAGEAIARAGTPVAFRDGTLHVACEDATWAHELQLLEPQLLRSLREAGATEVAAIRARAGGASGVRGVSRPRRG